MVPLVHAIPAAVLTPLAETIQISLAFRTGAIGVHRFSPSQITCKKKAVAYSHARGDGRQPQVSFCHMSSKNKVLDEEA